MLFVPLMPLRSAFSDDEPIEGRQVALINKKGKDVPGVAIRFNTLSIAAR